MEGVLGLECPGVGVPLRETEPVVWPGPEAMAEPDDVEDDPGASLPGARCVLPRGAGRGAARTTVRLPPAASDRAAGGESLPPTSAGSVNAAPSAAPMSAATAMIPRLLLKPIPRSADPL